MIESTLMSNYYIFNSLSDYNSLIRQIAIIKLKKFSLILYVLIILNKVAIVNILNIIDLKNNIHNYY